MNSNNTDTSTRPAPAGPHRQRRRYPWIVLAVLVVLAGLVAAAPAILSTSWGRQAVLDWYNGGIPGEVAVGHLSLSWLGSQSIRAVEVKDADGRRILQLQELTTDLSLIGALQQRLSLGRTEIRGLDADLRFGADGASNLARALGAGPAAPQGTGGGPVVPVTGNMTLADSRLSITAPGIEPVVLEDLTGAVEMTAPDAPVTLSFNGRSRQGALEGGISLDGTVTGLFPDGVLSPDKAVMDIHGEVNELPVDAVDQLLGAGGLLTTALGDRISLTLEAGGDAASREISLEARAPNGDIMLVGTVADGRFRLAAPARARLQLTPALVDELNTASTSPAFRLATAAPLHLKIERLEVPVSPFSLPGVVVQGAVTTPEPLRLTDVREIGDAAVNDLQLHVRGEPLGDTLDVSITGKPVTGGRTGRLTVEGQIKRLFGDDGSLRPARMTVTGRSSVSGVPTALVDTLLTRNGLLTAALGPEIGLELRAEANEKGDISVGLKLDSEHLETDELAFTVGDHMTLSRPVRARLTLTPQLWRTLLGEDGGYTLVEPAALILDLNNARLPLPGGQTPGLAADKTQLQATLSAKALSVRNGAGAATRIENLVVDLGGNSLGAMDVDVSGDVVQSEGVLADLRASPLRVKLDAQTGFDETLSLKRITGNLALDSPGLKTRLQGAIDEGFGRLSLTAPATVNAVVTPALLATNGNTEGPVLALRSPADVEARIDTLTLPLAPFHYAGLKAEGSARIDALAIQSTANVVTSIEGAEIDFGFQGADGGRANLEAAARMRPDGGEAGDLALKLTAGNLVDDGGRLNTSALSLDLDGKLQHLPVAVVDRLMNMEGLAVATLGATADFDLNAQLDRMRGPVMISLQSPNTRADVKARMRESGLTLEAPLTARIQPTPEFGSKVLARVHPIFETLQRSEQPIRFEAPAEGVVIPIENYDFSRVAVPEMTMDFGKLVLKSGWLLKGVIGLSQHFGKLDSVQKEEWEAWFTPGVMEIKDGRVLYKRRLDLLLADKLHLATWGNADVAADRSNLVLAFMPDTMERVFSITVSGDDALRVPIEGPLSSPRVDYKKTGADLARLRAQEEVSGENPLAGALLGAVTGKDARGRGGPIPPPSVTPLPWAADLKAQDAANKRQQDPEAAQSPTTSGQTAQGSGQAAPKDSPSTEEKVIKGLIDMFGKKKNKEQ